MGTGQRTLPLLDGRTSAGFLARCFALTLRFSIGRRELLVFRFRNGFPQGCFTDFFGEVDLTRVRIRLK